jgi:hypothetical protein
MMLGASAERGLGLIIGGRVLAGIGVGGASNMTVRQHPQSFLMIIVLTPINSLFISANCPRQPSAEDW